MSADTAGPRLTVIVPCRNEMGNLPTFLAGLEAQTLLPREVVVADGMSQDGSAQWLRTQAAGRPWLNVINNPEQIVPFALNHALACASGDIVARMDTHARYAPDYLATLVAYLVDHPEVGGAGSAMDTAGRGEWGRAIAATLRRPFGLGGARHRVGGGAGPIPHVFSGCYRTQVLLDVGGWDVRLHANEDFEADIRINASGAAIHLVPQARTVWYVRESLPALAKQMWRYGYYKGITLHLHPESLQLRQLAPPIAVLGLLLGWTVRRRSSAVAAAGYFLGTAALGACAARADGASPARGAPVPALVHLSWGTGLIMGWTRFIGTKAAASDQHRTPSSMRKASLHG